MKYLVKKYVKLKVHKEKQSHIGSFAVDKITNEFDL